MVEAPRRAFRIGSPRGSIKLRPQREPLLDSAVPPCCSCEHVLAIWSLSIIFDQFRKADFGRLRVYQQRRLLLNTSDPPFCLFNRLNRVIIGPSPGVDF